jgi:hypothetical protein
MLIISIASGVVLCLLFLILRWIFTKHKSKEENCEQGKGVGHFKSSNTGETTITNGFSADDISEIDGDIDLSTPLPVSSGSISRTEVGFLFIQKVIV